MQVGTFQTIAKYVFAAAVIGILVYIVVYVRRINTGNWVIDGSDDDVLKFISPKKDVIFTVQQGNQGVTVRNYLIKGDDHGLQFFSPKFERMSRMREKQLDVGDIAIVDRNGPLADNSGVLFVDLKRGVGLANINERVLHWPNAQMLTKAESVNGNPVFQVIDTKNQRMVLQAPPQQGASTYNLF